MTNVPEIFGCMVFNDTTMKARLPQGNLSGHENRRSGRQETGHQRGKRRRERDEGLGG